MEAFPHHYRAGFTAASGEPALTLASPGLAPLVCAAPAEFGGPGDQWSPETLLVAAIASCFALSFRSVAEASKFEWRRLDCQVDGTLDRQDRVTRFTAVALTVELEIDAAASAERAERLLHKAEEICLITNSMNAEVSFQARVKAV
jgi:peroxiredoxin-like protein